MINMQGDTDNTKSMPDIQSDERGYTSYPPSVLLFTDNSSEGLVLKRQLERDGCEVSQIEPIDESLAMAYQKFFDLIVLNLEELGVTISDELLKKLKTDPKLLNIPLAIIASRDCDKSTLDKMQMRPSVYCLEKDNSTKSRLLQLINQTQYLAHRYM